MPGSRGCHRSGDFRILPSTSCSTRYPFEPCGTNKPQISKLGCKNNSHLSPCGLSKPFFRCLLVIFILASDFCDFYTLKKCLFPYFWKIGPLHAFAWISLFGKAYSPCPLPHPLISSQYYHSSKRQKKPSATERAITNIHT